MTRPAAPPAARSLPTHLPASNELLDSRGTRRELCRIGPCPEQWNGETQPETARIGA